MKRGKLVCHIDRHDSEPPWHGIAWHGCEPVVPTEPVRLQFITAIPQYPVATDPAKRHVFAWSHVSGKATINRPWDVVASADMLTCYAAGLRQTADEMVIAQQ